MRHELQPKGVYRHQPLLDWVHGQQKCFEGVSPYQNRRFVWAENADHGGSYAVHFNKQLPNIVLYDSPISQPKPDGPLWSHPKTR